MESVKDLDLSKTTNMAETSYSILANGPGTGKSRFLQDLPTLIKNKAQNYIDDDELLEMLNNKMLSINITFNTNTGASEDDVSAGPASVALRILYEHFISTKGNLKPVQDIVRAVGKLKCSQEKIFYVPILAGTIQGPLEDMVKESLYDLTRLLLRLLSDSEMVVARAILNTSVEEEYEVEIDGKKFSLIDLSSKGIINLEMIPPLPGMVYVRMPYI
ncbi:15561_t:CDS:2 [Rhizophagus irregularis]|nr:15561_t:CDS:2 [Rhizophagus irregularis]